MRRLSIAATLALFALGTVGTASAQSVNCNQGNQATGTIVGAVLGGTVGGVIANNGRRSFSRRGFRGSRFNRRGFRRGNQGLGIVLGALAGGVVGNQVANANNRNCNSFSNQSHGSVYNSQNLSGGPIDYNARRLGDPYGGQRVVDQTQPVANPVSTQPGQVVQPSTSTNQGVFQPVCQNVNRSTRLPNGQILNEPVEYCQFSLGGEWIQR